MANLTRYAWLSVAAALITITMKMGAFWMTNSVSLLSDALESVVNLVAAIVALIALHIASRPADEEFSYGYSKIEFFASGFEGGMILIAAGSILVTAIPRLINPQPLEQIGLGMVIVVIASIVNLAVARVLLKAARKYNSITLEADSRHLMTDVFTTVGVVAGLIVVNLTGWLRLDAAIAILVAANILRTGISLLRRSGEGLMDVSLPQKEVKKIEDILALYEHQGLKFHALRTRSAARRSFVSMHILVPGGWSVQRAHHLAEEIEAEIRQAVSGIVVFTHVEPVEDPASWQDWKLDRDL
ncbi:MAG: cation diffusion facilitator family transporter [Anaerolineales bacterium]